MIGRTGKGLHSKPDAAGIVKGHEKKGRGRMYGVARVLATETMLDTDDRTPRAIVWYVYRHYLLRCAPQQNRYVSKSQQLLAEFDQPVQLPLTFDHITRHLAPDSFLDISEDVPRVDDLDTLHSEASLIKRPRMLRCAEEAARETDPPVHTHLDRARLLESGDATASSTEMAGPRR